MDQPPEGFAMRALLTALLVAASPAFAALEARDIDRDGQADAFFDTDQQLTWLTAPSIDLVDFDGAKAWVADLTFGGVDDWRLPKSFTFAGCDYSNGSPDCHLDPQTPDYSEVARYATYQDAVLPTWTWMTGLVGNSRVFYAVDRQEGSFYPFFLAQAVAVREGDVLLVSSPAPEPSTYLLLAAGLGFVWARARARTVTPC
jgi:hypothetical protein